MTKNPLTFVQLRLFLLLYGIAVFIVFQVVRNLFNFILLVFIPGFILFVFILVIVFTSVFTINFR